MIAYALLILHLAAAAPAAQDPGQVWPLDLDTRYLTSNFMERRPGRYHAGLDLKTNSSSGYVVRAAEDGWVSRIRAEAGAYGRAVYVRGASGRTTVYAHLERFADRIAARVDAARAESGRYRVRLQLEPGELPVAAGETLGLSGQSGTAGPHLHFEVRDEQQRPLDPQAWGFAVPDDRPPLIRSVTAHPTRPAPAGAGTGPGPQPVARTLTDAAGLAGTVDTLRVAGPVAFSADIVEHSDEHLYSLEPWQIEVRLDGELVYRRRNESFAFGANNTLRLEWCDVTDREGGTAFREQWLHRRPGVEVPGREGGLWYLGPDGRGLTPGVHVLEISAQDRAGNGAAVRVPLRAWRPGTDAAVAVGWTPVAAEIRAGGSGNDHLLTPFYAAYAPGAPPFAVRELDPAAGDPVLAPTVMWCEAGTPLPGPADPAAGLRALGWSARYLAADWPLDGELRMDMDAAPADTAAWVFRWSGADWRPVGPVRREGGGAWFGLAEPGLYAAFRDDGAPLIDDAPVSVRPRRPRAVPGVTLPRWQTVPVTVTDAGTGVDPASLVATLDGAPLIVEPDLVRSRVLVTVPDATLPGHHELRLEAADGAGNRAEATISLELR